jgi:hypothetical protein
VDALIAVAETLGRSPRPLEFERERQKIQDSVDPTRTVNVVPTAQVIRGHFGTWNDSLAAAGLPRVQYQTPSFTGERRPAYALEEKVEWLRRAWTEVGEPFTSAAYKTWRSDRMKGGEEEIPSLPIIVRTFGGWKEAKRVARPGG